MAGRCVAMMDWSLRDQNDINRSRSQLLLLHIRAQTLTLICYEACQAVPLSEQSCPRCSKRTLIDYSGSRHPPFRTNQLRGLGSHSSYNGSNIHTNVKVLQDLDLRENRYHFTPKRHQVCSLIQMLFCAYTARAPADNEAQELDKWSFV